MTGDAGSRWGLGRWFSPSRPPAIDPITPAPPADIVSSPGYHPPSNSTSFQQELYPPPSSAGDELYPPPPASGYELYPPQDEPLYPPSHPDQHAQANHSLGHSHRQVADPMGQVYGGSMQHGSARHSGRVTDENEYVVSPGSAIQQHGSARQSGRVTDENEYIVPPGSAIQLHGAAEFGYLLHGTLETRLYEAVNLPNMDMFSERVRVFAHDKLPGPLEKLKKATGVHGPTTVITSDPYTVVMVAGASVARTRVINNNTNPKWNEHFLVPVAHHAHHVAFVVKDQDVMGSQRIGKVTISAKLLFDGGVVDGWFDVLDNDGKPCHAGAKLRVSARYHPVEHTLVYAQGVGTALGVPNTYFPLRKGCRLTLYQDAHVYDDALPKVMLDGGLSYNHGRCWEDISTAIHDAQHLVYIVGWSVWDKVALVRDVKHPLVAGGNLTLGELLKLKSRQGVRVLLLLWDDKSSHDLHFVKTSGVMNTFDEETKKFFKNSGVRCVLAPRYGASKTTWFRQRVVGSLYTHHQKCVIVDSGPLGQRRLSAFVGGLDLTGGRWDTPSHHIFASLQNEHKGDFRNKSWEYAPESGGPREPWHDLHCRIEGHAAYDVLTNFEQRWRKATSRHDEELLDIERHEGLWGPSNRAPDAGDPALFATSDQDPETWHVQIFRSIDSGSVKGFPSTIDEVHQENLVWGKSLAIDISIQMAYINAIRCAQHFIYIENQYFLGSSYNWPDYTSAGANHIIPMELALKICSKIREGKKFAVYVLVPMWPEGFPDSGAVQEILYFQSQTMKMMYNKIADTLREVGSSQAKPTDYLNFYCLGTRETVKPGEYTPLQPPDNSSKRGLSQMNRRMMIYVHSKGMVVDDELVIIGSANINQRSMDGSRDTEIAMGGFQPYHTWVQKKGHPRGQVYGYRMSLWAEHLGGLELVFEEPESFECVRRVNSIADQNWEQYAAPEITDMRSHLIRFPIKVEDDGTVTNLPGYLTFPDVGGKIMGSNQPQIPDDLTT